MDNKCTVRPFGWVSAERSYSTIQILTPETRPQTPPSISIIKLHFFGVLLFGLVYIFLNSRMSNVMKSITQKLDYGCGVACFASVCNMTFEEAVEFLGKEYSVKHGWKPSDLVLALNKFGYNYKNHYVRKRHIVAFPPKSIVLIERSKNYPVGHYLTLTPLGWMDPWINLPETNDIQKAKSGFRKELPGKAMYALVPISS